MVTIEIKAFNKDYLPPPVMLNEWLSIWRPKLAGSIWGDAVYNNDRADIKVTAAPVTPGALQPVITADSVNAIILPQINQYNQENQGLRAITVVVGQ